VSRVEGNAGEWPHSGMPIGLDGQALFLEGRDVEEGLDVTVAVEAHRHGLADADIEPGRLLKASPRLPAETDRRADRGRTDQGLVQVQLGLLTLRCDDVLCPDGEVVQVSGNEGSKAGRVLG